MRIVIDRDNTCCFSPVFVDPVLLTRQIRVFLVVPCSAFKRTVGFYLNVSPAPRTYKPNLKDTSPICELSNDVKELIVWQHSSVGEPKWNQIDDTVANFQRLTKGLYFTICAGHHLHTYHSIWETLKKPPSLSMSCVYLSLARLTTSSGCDCEATLDNTLAFKAYDFHILYLKVKKKKVLFGL